MLILEDPPSPPELRFNINGGAPEFCRVACWRCEATGLAIVPDGVYPQHTYNR